MKNDCPIEKIKFNLKPKNITLCEEKFKRGREEKA